MAYEPSLHEVLEAKLAEHQENIHTSLPAHIISYDPSTGMAQLQISISKMLPDGDVVDYPPLVNVPVKQMRGGGWFIHMPLNEFDTGIAHFCEKSIDDWVSTGGVVEPTDYRQHDISDAIFDHGISPKNNPIPLAHSEDFTMGAEDGSIVIRLKRNGTAIVSNKSGASFVMNADGTFDFIGKAHFHDDINCEGDVSDKKGSMDQMRSKYNPHTHGDSPPPSLSMG